MLSLGKGKVKIEETEDSMNYISNIEINYLLANTIPGELIKEKAVIELYVTKEPMHGTWIKCLIGIACFIRNQRFKSYYIKIYSLKDRKYVHSEEIYKNFEIGTSNDTFLQFEGKNRMVGLNFYFSREAQSFKNAVSKTSEGMSKKKKINTLTTMSQNQNSIERVDISKPTTSIKSTILKKFRIDDIFKQNSDLKKQPVKKREIGVPTDFRHILLSGSYTIPGYSAENGFKLEDCTIEWLILFVSLKLNGKLLSNPQVAKEIVNFVEQHGGINKIAAAIETKDKNKSQRELKIKKSFHESTSPGANKPTIILVTPTQDIGEKSEGNKNSNINSYVPTAPPPAPPLHQNLCLTSHKKIPPPPPPRDIPPIPSKVSSIKINLLSASSRDSSSAQTSLENDRHSLLHQIKMGGKVLKSAGASNEKVIEEEDDSIVGLLAKRLKTMNVMVADSDDQETENDDEWDD